MTQEINNKKILPRKFLAKEVEKEVNEEALKVVKSESLSKWLQDPHIRRQASMQIQRMNIVCNKKDNEALYTLKIKEKQLEKLLDILRNLKERSKEDPETKAKLATLTIQSEEMADKVFEETEYTNTLNYMADRYKKTILSKQQPMQNKLKAFEFIMNELYRWRNQVNRLKQSVTKEIQPVHKDMEPVKKELLSLRKFQKLKEAAKERQEHQENALLGLSKF